MISFDIKSLAAVILRRNISATATDTGDLADQENNANLWMRLSDRARATVMHSIIQTLQTVNAINKTFMHKVCNVAIEI